MAETMKTVVFTGIKEIELQQSVHGNREFIRE